jgi:hypothetical protein
VRLLVLLGIGVAGAAHAAGDPGTCPPGGFERTDCLLAIVRERAPCGPARFEASLAKRLARVTKLVALAETDRALGRDRVARKSLRRAARTVRTSHAKTIRMAARGLAFPCAEALDGLLATLAGSLAALRFGAPPATVPAATTTTTSSTPPPTAGPATTVTTTTSVPTTVPPATCGNGRLDPGEQCDGENLFGRDCKTLGFVSGTLRCDANCIFDNRDCREPH